MSVLGLGPVLKDSLRAGDKSLVLALALRLHPWNPIVLGSRHDKLETCEAS